jgi:hypothetical protein
LLDADRDLRQVVSAGPVNASRHLDAGTGEQHPGLGRADADIKVIRHDRLSGLLDE